MYMGSCGGISIILIVSGYHLLVWQARAILGVTAWLLISDGVAPSFHDDAMLTATRRHVVRTVRSTTVGRMMDENKNCHDFIFLIHVLLQFLATSKIGCPRRLPHTGSGSGAKVTSK